MHTYTHTHTKHESCNIHGEVVGDHAAGSGEPLGHGPEPTPPPEWPLELSERCALAAGAMAVAQAADDKQVCVYVCVRACCVCLCAS